MMNSPDTGSTMEKPQNGIAGLKHLRHDILSGIVVSLVSLPLSSGIAIASGLPPIYGLTSAIIAGLLFPFIGGAYLTISGPAAGLAPAVMAVMVSLGGAGDAEHVGAGYPHLLVVIFLVGCIQVILSLLKLARFAAVIPATVVEGMLASIGLLIMVKQMSMLFGYTGKVHAHEFFEFVAEIPEFATHMTPKVFAVGAASLVLLFVMAALSKKVRLFQILPPQLLVVVFGAAMGYAVGLEGKYLIKLPENILHGIQTPDFRDILNHKHLWYPAIMGILMLTMIDGVESLATAMAIDRIDPWHRKSNPNRVLMAMALSNIASSLVGGLTIIPGGVKSKANIASGGRTLWANFTNSICLIIYLCVAASWINMIPKTVLAAVLIFTGWKMCEPAIWKHIAHIGKEQLAIYSFTILTTLMTDLLIGIFAGVAANFVLNLLLCRHVIVRLKASGDQSHSLMGCAGAFFSNPISKKELVDNVYHMYVNRSMVSFNSMQLSEELDKIPTDVKEVVLHLDPNVLLIDHTSAETLMHVKKELSYSSIPVHFQGIEKMHSLSHHNACVRLANYQVASQSA